MTNDLLSTVSKLLFAAKKWVKFQVKIEDHIKDKWYPERKVFYGHLISKIHFEPYKTIRVVVFEAPFRAKFSCMGDQQFYFYSVMKWYFREAPG